MKYRKSVINITVISVAFILFAVWYHNNFVKTTQVMQRRIEDYKVYLITTDKQTEYWYILDKGASDMAKAIGVRYFWEAPEERNVDTQIEIINQAVDAGANALLVAADNPKLISSVIEDAKARGVKVIYVDSPAFEEAITTLATDNYEAGVVAGQTMLSILEERNIESGSIGIINIVEKANSELRERGIRDVLEADGRYQLLDTYYSEGDPVDARVVAELIIEENEDLVGLFGTTTRTSIGVGNAIQAHDNNYVGVGFDKTETTLRLLQEGSLKAIIDQNPYTMGYLGVAEAIAAILGKNTGPSYIDTGVSVIR